MKLLRMVALLAVWPVVLLATVTSQVDKTGPFLLTSLPATLSTGFPFVNSSDLLVLDLGPTGSPHDPAQVLTLGSDYTVTGGNYNVANQMQPGAIVLVSSGAHAVAANDYIVIMRNVPINQTSVLAPGPLTLALIEQAIDKQATLSQQVNEIARRSLQFENFESLSGVLNKAARSSNYLAFDAAGNPVFLSGTSSPADLSAILATATGGTQSRTIGAHLADIINVADFLGADPTGAVDSSAAIQAAINALGSKGGNIILGFGKYRLSSSITINAGVNLIGSTILKNPRDTSVFTVLGGALLLDAGVTIHGKQAGSLQGLTIAKTSMTFPQNAAAVAAWTDTAITVDAGAHGFTVTGCNVVGFARFLDMGTASFTEKTTVTNDVIDCLAGARIVSGTDSPWFAYLNFWPLASASGSPVDADLQRPGIAIDLEATTAAIDSASLSHIHTYGYAVGEKINGANGTTLTDVVNDYTATQTTTVRGIWVVGDAIDTEVANCRGYRQTNSIDFEPTLTNEAIEVVNYDSEFATNAGFYATSGSGSIVGSKFRNLTVSSPFGIELDNCNGSCRFTLDDNYFDYQAVAISIHGTTPGDVAVIGAFTATGNGNNTIVGSAVNTAASATALIIPPDHDFIKVSGTTAITSISSAYARIDRTITLYFTGILTLTNGTSLKLAGSTNLTTANGTRVSFKWDGAAWEEVARTLP